MKSYWQILLICSLFNAVYSEGEVVAGVDAVSQAAQTAGGSQVAQTAGGSEAAQTAATDEISQTQADHTPKTSPTDTPTQALAKAAQDRKSLAEFLIANPNAKSCRASTYMQKFIETHRLQALPNLNLLDFQRYLRSVDPSVDPTNVADIHPHYLRYIEFVKNLKSRNRLVKYLKDNPSATLLEISTRIEEFLNGHRLFQTSPDITDDEFTKLMRSRDNFISDAQIALLRPKVRAYLTYHGKAKAREELLKAIGKDKSVALSKVKDQMAVFITKFGMATLGSTSTEKTAKRHIMDQDHFVYPEDVDLIYPIYIKYVEYEDRSRVRTALLAKISASPSLLTDNKIIYRELEDFMTKYNLKEVDVSDSIVFDKTVKEQDFEISPQQIAEIQPYAKRYRYYGNRAAIRTNVKTFITQNPTATPLALQPYMTPFIEAFELAEVNTKSAFIERINDYEQPTPRADDASESTLFTKFTSFKEFYQQKDKFIKLLEYIKTTTSHDQTTLAGLINAFLGQFTGWTDDIYYVDAFIRKIKEFDSSISNEDLKTVHAQVKSHKIQMVKESCRSELQTELDKTGDAKNQELINSKIDVLVAVYGLQDENMSTEQTFISKIKLVDDQVVDAQLTQMYQPVKTRMESKEFKDKIAAMIRAVKPGDVGEDNTIAPPAGGFKRFWYDFFGFFGAKPHTVSGVKSHSELFVFKRWFNAIYKWLTDIDFYILTDAVAEEPPSQLPLTSEVQTDQTAAVEESKGSSSNVVRDEAPAVDNPPSN